MPRNLEIKARIDDPVEVHKAAALLSGDAGRLIVQEDVFFNVPSGRLKLRFLSSSEGELIFYHRSDRPGPKLSSYQVVPTDRPGDLCSVLAAAYGELARVRKRRQLYLAGRTRVHVDQVEGLGDFVELEVVLAENDQTGEAEAEARHLMERLGLNEAGLIPCAYLDLLLRGGKATSAQPPMTEIP